ncbi:hypothetical protein LOTGIDRAFT_232335 [Lottia gigantea]|uniref:Uncharacterized protein n=1 Tax=Lottia gigantea TaxID=225164 RepID=V4AH47_LOTGI|nr:hypothetical protein LOTGIDRAFT_232335 [Lottia gigantea]ESO94500.1 hypothetical protein LOTGIDRAFT_232335 [Lottia gigantea]
MEVKLSVRHIKSGKSLADLTGFKASSTIKDVKLWYHQLNPKLDINRISFRVEPRGKTLKDDQTLLSTGIAFKGEIYFKDLGPQIGWTTVFLTEYAGPLVVYLLFYIRPSIVYGAAAANLPYAKVVNIAAICWTAHYAKRLFETVFIHRFSNATMPIMNIFKNSIYYWGFAAFVSYFINHPLYTVPMYGDKQIYGGLALFIFAELGNLSVHVALRNLRPAGSRVRKIPFPTINPFTWLFYLTSCPNYTYEVMAWVGFSVMAQSVPAAMFTLAGFYQMAVWAKGKHRNYVSEFRDYPRIRTPIIPFLL